MKKFHFLLIVILTSIFSICAIASFTPDQVKQTQQITHDYLLQNPQILVEMSTKLQQQRQAQIQATAQKLIRENAKEIFNNSSDPVAGNPKGDVTLVEFIDFQCRHCRAMEPIVAKLIKEDSSLRVVYKDLPVMGPNSVDAAKAAAAAQKQGRYYYEFHKALMKGKTPLTEDRIMKIAKSVGLNVAKLKRDMQTKAVAQQLQDDIKLAQTILQPTTGSVSTPTFIIGNRQETKFALVPGHVTEAILKKAIAQVR